MGAIRDWMARLMPVCLAGGLVATVVGQRTFTDIEGRSITADVKSVDGEAVVFVIRDKPYRVTIDRLIKEDREYLKTWEPVGTVGDPKLVISYSDEADRSKKNEHRTIFHLETEVRNADNREAFSGGVVDVLVMMRHIRVRSAYAVGARYEVEVGEVPELRSELLEPREYTHGRSGEGTDQRGWRFFGYVVVLKDTGGQELTREVSSGIDEELVERLMTYEEGTLLSRNYRPLNQEEKGKVDANLLPKPVQKPKGDQDKNRPKREDRPLVE